MTAERIKEIQQQTAYPDSISVQQALLQVWNECSRLPQQETLYTEEQVRELLYYYDLEIKKHLLNYTIEHSLHSKMCDGINDVRNTYIQSLKQPKQ